MAKQIIYSEEGRMRLKAGVDKLSNAVKVTLGPKGKTVILSKKFGSPTIIDDGVTIAKEVELEDNFEDMGLVRVERAQAQKPVREAPIDSPRSQDEGGDEE